MVPLSQLLEMQRRLTDMTAERDGYRAMWRSAERELASVRAEDASATIPREA